MSFNQISGKIHAHRPSLRRTERQLSHEKMICQQSESDLISKIDTSQEFPQKFESPLKNNPKLRLPNIRRQSIGKIDKINLKTPIQRIFFFDSVYKQQKQSAEKALSPVQESRLSIKMPKKVSLNRSEQRAKQQEESIIFNYLNEKVSFSKPKKKKKKKKLPKSAQKLQKSYRMYVLPTSDPRIHRRQKTEFKLVKQDKIDIGSIIQKRRSLDVDNQKDLFILKRQSETIQRQSKLLDELKKRVNEVQKYHNLSKKTPNQAPNKKYSLSNRTFKGATKQANEKEESCQEPQSSFLVQSSIKDSLDLNNTFRTIEKIPKPLRFSTVIKESQRKMTGNVIPFTLAKSNDDSDQNLAQTIKYNDESKEQPSSKISRENLSSGDCSKLEHARVEKQSSDEQDESDIESDNPAALENLNIDQGKQTIDSKISPNQPLRIPDKYFLSLRTYYASITVNRKVTIQNTSCIQSQPPISVPNKIPSKQQIPPFIQNYKPQNQTIKIANLISLQNFQVVLEQDQELYFGQIVSQVKCGLGITIRHNYLYEGLYQNGDKVQGLQVTENGKYMGQFKNNKKQGNGKFLWNNGQIYGGQWLNGKKHGHGTWSSLTGDTYVGEWVRGKVQGHGIHTSKTGQKYEGSFHEFLKSGWGKEFLPNGDIYKGEFSNGKPNGSGKYVWKQGQTYKGQFQQGFRQGHGALKDEKGNLFIGFFEKEEPIGKCELTFKSEDSYSGQIRQGKFHGKGTLILYEQEQIWKGYWEDDAYLGQMEGTIE